MTVWFWVLKALVRIKKSKMYSAGFTQDAFEAKRTSPWRALWGEAQARRSALRRTMGATSQSSARRWASGRAEATLQARWRRHMGPSGRQGRWVGASAAGGPWEEVPACEPDLGQASAASSRCTRRGLRCQQQSEGASQAAGGAPAGPASASRARRTAPSSRAGASEPTLFPLLPGPPRSPFPAHQRPAQPPPFSRSFSNPQLLEQPLSER